MTEIIDLVDDRAAPGFVSEHGLSLWIRHGGERILFDTGAGGALAPNARTLGVDLGSASRIVLSHSHNDHTGGLAAVPVKCPVHVGRGFGAPCYSRHADGSVHSLAVPEASRRVLAASLSVVAPTFEEIAPGVFLSGAIVRGFGREGTSSFFRDAACTIPDSVSEEQTLLTDDGVLVTGCCHAGLVNTVRSFTSRPDAPRIRAIVGGLHLLHADGDELLRLADFLGSLELEKLVLLHCTGDAAVALLESHLACEVVRGRAGDRFSFGGK